MTKVKCDWNMCKHNKSNFCTNSEIELKDVDGHLADLLNCEQFEDESDLDFETALDLLSRARDIFKMNLSGYTSIKEIELLHDLDEFYRGI